MSRAHAVAPAGAIVSYRGPAHVSRILAPGVASRPRRPAESCYVERALLLWPRLDRARLRKVGAAPCRIAEMVERRTSQPYDVILAMLTRQSDQLNPQTEAAAGFAMRTSQPTRATLRLVRMDEGAGIEVHHRLPA